MANENQQLEVYRAYREEQGKYTYFLLAAAGAAIALAVNQTQGATISWSQAPLALAVFCWGLSVFCGCRHLVYVNSSLYANFEFLKIINGQHPETGRHPQLIAAASEGVLQAINKNSNRAAAFALWQFRLLVAGAVLYITWHVLEMYLRSLP